GRRAWRTGDRPARPRARRRRAARAPRRAARSRARRRARAATRVPSRARVGGRSSRRTPPARRRRRRPGGAPLSRPLAVGLPWPAAMAAPPLSRPRSARARFDPPVLRARWTLDAPCSDAELLASLPERTGWDAATI